MARARRQGLTAAGAFALSAMFGAVALALSCVSAPPAPAAMALWPREASDSIGRTTTFYAAVRYTDGSVLCYTADQVTVPGHWPAGCDSAAAVLDSGDTTTTHPLPTRIP